MRVGHLRKLCELVKPYYKQIFILWAVQFFWIDGNIQYFRFNLLLK